jgi:hypothetical protein
VQVFVAIGEFNLTSIKEQREREREREARHGGYA